MNSIFVFAYYSYKDPVFQSAVLPYLKLANGSNQSFIVLTWEKEEFAVEVSEKEVIDRFLRSQNIIWYATKWHSGKLKFFKKGFDLVKGLVFSWYLIRKHKAKKIYSEGFPGAVIGHYLSKISGKPHIIHTFEPHADYMVEAGVWTRRSWEFKLLKMLEVPIANHAQSIVTATEAYKHVLLSRGIKDHIQVIPSCIDTTRFRYLFHERQQIRSQLDLQNHHTVIVYLGKLGGMYMDRELFAFFASCLKFDKDKFFFFLFTNDNNNLVMAALREFNIPSNKVLVKYLTTDQVPAYLSAADIAFCGIRPIPSRRFSSPIKNGEYWACGLPVLIPQGISDDYILCVKEDIGFSFKTISEINLGILESLKAKNRFLIETKCFVLRGIEHYRKAIIDVFWGQII